MCAAVKVKTGGNTKGEEQDERKRQGKKGKTETDISKLDVANNHVLANGAQRIGVAKYTVMYALRHCSKKLERARHHLQIE
jgi:hypothetical protein